MKRNLLILLFFMAISGTNPGCKTSTVSELDSTKETFLRDSIKSKVEDVQGVAELFNILDNIAKDNNI